MRIIQWRNLSVKESRTLSSIMPAPLRSRLGSSTKNCATQQSLHFKHGTEVMSANLTNQFNVSKKSPASTKLKNLIDESAVTNCRSKSIAYHPGNLETG